MLFAAGALLMAIGVLPAAAFNVASNHGRARVRGERLTGDVDPAFLNEHGLITSWRAADPYDDELIKRLVSSGMIDGYNVNQIQDECSRFRKFDKKCLSSKVSALRKQHREAAERAATMAANRGGGQGLQARQPDPSSQPDSFQQRFGDDIYNEADDPDYDPSDHMSTLSMEDECSLGTRRSYAVRSRAGRSVGNVSFANNPCQTGSCPPPGILRPSSHGTARSNAASASIATRDVLGRDRGVSNGLHGGAHVHWIAEHWVSCNENGPCKRSSIQLHAVSCTASTAITHRVSTDQKSLVVSMMISHAQTTLDGLMCANLRCIQHHKFINTVEDAVAFLANHPRIVARAKTQKRIQAENPTIPNKLVDIRIPIPYKADYNLVTKAEDPIFYGRHCEILDNQKHIYIELKAQPKDGHAAPPPVAPRPAASTASRMSSIPEEISFDDESRRSNRSFSSRPEGATMCVETVFSSSEDEEHSVMDGETALLEKELQRVEDDMKEEVAAAEGLLSPNSAAGESVFVSAQSSVGTCDRSISTSPKKKSKRIRSGASVATAVTAASKRKAPPKAKGKGKSSGSSVASKGSKGSKSSKVTTRSSSKAKKAPAGPKTTGESDDDVSL